MMHCEPIVYANKIIEIKHFTKAKTTANMMTTMLLLLWMVGKIKIKARGKRSGPSNFHCHGYHREKDEYSRVQ